jgi:hypothetical protein
MMRRHSQNPGEPICSRGHHVLNVAYLIEEQLRLDRSAAMAFRNFLPLRAQIDSRTAGWLIRRLARFRDHMASSPLLFVTQSFRILVQQF